MPNLCWNRLVIDGAFADRREFEAWNETMRLPGPDGEQLTLPFPPLALAHYIRLGFDAMAPLPPDLAMLGGDELTTWQLSNWGTPGNPIGTIDCMDDGRRLTYIFHTDDRPPREWLFAMSYKFQDLIFTLDFTERIGACAGPFTVANEEILEHVEAESVDDADYIAREWFGLDDLDFRPA